MKDIDRYVATIGMFDGLHIGHQYLLKQMKEIAFAKKLKTAVITFSQHPKSVLYPTKKTLLINSIKERNTRIKAIGIDNIIELNFTKELSSLTAKEFITKLHDEYNVDIVVIGYDHKFGHNREDGFEDYVEYGKKIGVDILKAEEYELENSLEIGSSYIRELLLTNEIEKANRLLGYNFTIRGIIIDGHKEGRKLGFPTANIKIIDKDKIIPADGVYAIYIYVKGEKYKGMMSIGFRPTMNNGKDRSIEVHIFDFNDSIYGEEVRVEVVSFLRKEKHFPSITELIAALEQDKNNSLRIL